MKRPRIPVALSGMQPNGGSAADVGRAIKPVSGRTENK